MAGIITASGAIATIVFLSLPFSAPLIALTTVAIVLTILPGLRRTTLNPSTAPPQRQLP